MKFSSKLLLNSVDNLTSTCCFSAIIAQIKIATLSAMPIGFSSCNNMFTAVVAIKSMVVPSWTFASFHNVISTTFYWML